MKNKTVKGSFITELKEALSGLLLGLISIGSVFIGAYLIITPPFLLAGLFMILAVVVVVFIP